jgi:hypothetical protein
VNGIGTVLFGHNQIMRTEIEKIEEKPEEKCRAME